MDRPKYLYHASPQKNLKKIMPRANTLPRDFHKGPVVFATDDFSFSTEFIVPTDDSWANGGAFSGVCYFVISDRERFAKLDNGGFIYLVPSETFERFNNREWTSKEPVRVESSVYFDSGLEAMLVTGIQVYFVNSDTYSEIQNAHDHGASILNSIESENERWGLPVQELDLYKGSKKKVG